MWNTFKTRRQNLTMITDVPCAYYPRVALNVAVIAVAKNEN